MSHELVLVGQIVERRASFQMRKTGEDIATVNRYTRDIEAGAMREPLLLWQAPEGSLVVIDGHHRLHGYAKAGHTAVPAIVLRGVSEAAAFVTAGAANVVHSKAWSAADRLRFVRRGIVDGLLVPEGSDAPLTATCEAAAQILGMKPDTVMRAVRRACLKDRELQRAVEALKDSASYRCKQLKLDPQQLQAEKTAKHVRQAARHLNAALECLKAAGLGRIKRLPSPMKATVLTQTKLSNQAQILERYVAALAVSARIDDEF